MAEDVSPGGRGRIGAEIFDQVERMLAEDKVTRSEAFKRVSAQSGRKPGTVAANYYRVARQRGTPLASRGRRAEGRGRARARTGGNEVGPALRKALAALDELSGAVRRQEQEIQRLRAENASFEQIRRLMRKVK
jgi:hypothetical protein